MYSEQNRVFSYAVLASVALHGALLFGFTQRGRVPLPLGELPPLIARLAQPPAPPAPLAAPPPPSPAQAMRPAPPVAQKPAPRPRPSPAPQPVAKAPPAPVSEPPVPPASVPDEPVAQSPAPVEPASPPVVARAEAPAQSAAQPSEAPAARAAQAVLDPGSVDRYRLQLIGAARKYKRYPRLAMENNWQGNVVVRMAFGGNGLLAGLTIESSSGHSVLDQQALEMFRQAAKTIEVPPGLRGREFSFEVRAIYNLKDQDSG